MLQGSTQNKIVAPPCWVPPCVQTRLPSELAAELEGIASEYEADLMYAQQVGPLLILFYVSSLDPVNRHCLAPFCNAHCPQTSSLRLCRNVAFGQYLH